MAPTILIKFCAFIVHSKPNNMTLSAFPGKIPQIRKIDIDKLRNKTDMDKKLFFTFLYDRRLTERLTQLTNISN